MTMMKLSQLVAKSLVRRRRSSSSSVSRTAAAASSSVVSESQSEQYALPSSIVALVAATAGVTSLCLYGEKEQDQNALQIVTTTTTTTRLDDNGAKHIYSGGLPFRTGLRRHRTVDRLEKTATRETLESKYEVNWKEPLGQGAFGAVFVATNRTTGGRVAVKQISKRYTDNEAFQREADALLHIRDCGGHPNICGLRENYEEGDYFFLVLDLVDGGEMFDNLCAQGAYSEADAARMLREVASALAFMAGIGIVHGDMKPENLMLSTENAKDAVVQVVDFGCAQVQLDDDEAYDITGRSANATYRSGRRKSSGSASTGTPAYSPPEVISKQQKKRHEKTRSTAEDDKLNPSIDMWAMGVILYIMLTGVHPFDLYGDATEEEIEQLVLSGKKPPLQKSPITAHLSQDAIALIEQLLQREPSKRLTADQLLAHPWVRGETARTSKMQDIDKRLRLLLEAKVFAGMVSMTDSDSPTGDDDELLPNEQGHGHSSGSSDSKRTSLIERSFQMLDVDKDGYVTKDEILKQTENVEDNDTPRSDKEELRLSLSSFSEFLSDHMKDKYFPKGHVVYEEGDVGNTMYFLNSGTIEVYTKDGFSKLLRKPGDFFGEGALLNPTKIRSAGIRCITPVHAIEVNREYFEKYLANQAGTKLDLTEKDRSRKRNRAKSLLQLQQNMKERSLKKGEFLFLDGERGKEMFIVDKGHINIPINGRVAISIHEGQLCGEHTLFFDRPRNVSAVCASDTCKVRVLNAPDFFALMSTQPSLRESFREICYRREFRKALCHTTKKPFPKTEQELRAAFDTIDTNHTGAIELCELRAMIKRFDPQYTEENIHDILKSLDLSNTGQVTWEEFRRIFRMKRGRLHM